MTAADSLPTPSAAAPRTGNPSTDRAIAMLLALVAEGVTDVVLCPGSRSQALALVAAELERVEGVRLHVRIDERAAGFLALGLGVESGRPAPVITTSGTAVANLHPAVLEGWHSGVPMLLLTGDRPAELRGIASNQTTHQLGMFGDRVACIDVAAPEETDDDRARDAVIARDAYRRARDERTPVHVNVAFRDPLSVAVPDLTEAVAEARAAADEAAASAAPAPAPAADVLDLPHGPRTLVVAGHAAGEAAEELARAGGWPLAAEISSGSHFGPHLVVSFRELLARPGFGDRVERVIVFGHPTLTREVPLLIGREDVEAIVVGSTGGEDYDPRHRVTAHPAAVRVVGEPADPADARRWLGTWVQASRAILDEATAAESAPLLPSGTTPAERRDFARAELAAVRADVTRRHLVRALWQATWPHDRLVLGASRLIREADRALPGKRVRVHANRGLAGIDGTVSTGLGIALASQAGSGSAAAGITRVLVGDLTLLHDVGSLLIGTGERVPRIQVIVGNDGGGTIFDGLEVADTAAPAAIDRVMFTPQRVDLASLAKAYGWTHLRASTHGELEAALTTASEAPLLIEVPLAR
ncbi:2-succinyl-5-enolpyruvyl-6-hydroxy-3-cyclohexene-1-carboxylic-acid synthase [Clavibacter michiganensis]|uniref:2-succinyl-5-enolpyruvyl-6-hydroxy-3-cyclohexene-1-carboxylate synthase n=4 Tax=Clavibacter michiganensis TaxID=28447 RepID=A0A0D5CKL6_9MICO|nr:2-succinyl-5-enolpyruvyl-6-hydroxy-3-cyclohexene-1-carboxylic-acid synthase [Clavibacter michiganensis]AJW80163.1 2-succinyl-5-enolpyruvyl-6-hydroxy-3-cyclohexene-1-carboxylate synthase [Clavibacter michiganensis subsp. insidiosus]AWF97169.1 2-succinyl-5-enolpyruvyl-6-hydroxy-3-cyclohexene -1-carboxylate synthase [Clavibacter michiganensis subsp. insidiosus]